MWNPKVRPLFPEDRDVEPPRFAELPCTAIRCTPLNAGVLLISLGVIGSCGFNLHWAWYAFSGPGAVLVLLWLGRRLRR